MYTALESSLFEMSKSAAAAEYLRLNDIARALKLGRYIESFVWCSSYIS